MANRKPRKRTPRKDRASLERHDHTDLVWVGPILGDETEEPVDPENVLREHGFDRETPLEQLLLRLIDAGSPKDAAGREKRLRAAVAAITGTRMAKEPNYAEYDFLLEVAVEYHRRYIENQRNIPDLKPIIEFVLSDIKWKRLKAGSPRSQVDDLARKFKSQADLLLVRATTGPDWDPLNRRARLREIANELAELGVPIATGYSPPVSKDK